MKKKSLIIVVVIIIIAVLGLIIAIMSKPTNTNKEDNRVSSTVSNTESSQTESEYIDATESTEQSTEQTSEDEVVVKPDTGLTLEEYDKKKEEGTLTKEDMLSLGLEDMSLEEFYKRGEDGCLYGDVVYTDENITYILLDDGTKIFPGDKFPDGGMYGGRTPEDKEYRINH